MTTYVKIDSHLSQHELVQLAEKLINKGFSGSIEYFSGGWTDSSVSNIAPHLKFNSEDEALIYVLTYGGEMSRDVPKIFPDQNYIMED